MAPVSSRVRSREPGSRSSRWRPVDGSFGSDRTCVVLRRQESSPGFRDLRLQQLLASTGFVVDYGPGGGPSHDVSVFTVADHGGLLGLIRSRDRDWLQTAEARGRPALLVDRDEGGDQQLVAWVEEAGTIGVLSATGMSGNELLALAEQVRPASEQEWDELEGRGPRYPQPLNQANRSCSAELGRARAVAAVARARSAPSSLDVPHLSTRRHPENANPRSYRTGDSAEVGRPVSPPSGLRFHAYEVRYGTATAEGLSMAIEQSPPGRGRRCRCRQHGG